MNVIHPSPPIHRAVHVANYFLRRKRNTQPLLLMHLALLAHAWNLAIHDRPLFTEAVRTRPYGPYVPPLFYLVAATLGAGATPKALPETPAELPEDLKPVADRFFILPDPRPEAFTSDQEGILDTVHQTYAGLASHVIDAQLVEDGGAWHLTRQRLGDDQIIDNVLLKDHFTRIAARHPAPPQPSGVA